MVLMKRLTLIIDLQVGDKSLKKEFYEGIVNNLERRYMETTSEWIRTWIGRFYDRNNLS